MITNRYRILVGAFAFFAWSLVLLSQETFAQTSKTGKVGAGIFLRLATDTLAGAKQKPFEHKSKVEEVVLGTNVHGQCVSTGNVVLRPEGKAGNYQIFVQGKCITTSVGENGPAIISTTSTTDFAANSLITFNRETGFSAGPLTVRSETKLNTDDVRVNRGGLIGRVVQSIAEERVEESQAEATEIAKKHSAERIREAIQGQIDERLASLNHSFFVLKSIVKVAAPDLLDRMRISSAEDHQFVYFAPKDDAITIDLDMFPATNVPCELWIHKSLMSKINRFGFDGALLKKLVRSDFFDIAETYFVSSVSPIQISNDYQFTEKHGDWSMVRLPSMNFDRPISHQNLQAKK